MNCRMMFIIAVGFLAAGCSRGNDYEVAQTPETKLNYVTSIDAVSTDVVMLAGKIDTIIKNSKTAVPGDKLFAANEVESIVVYDLQGNFAANATVFKNSYYVSLPKGKNYILKTKTKGYGTMDTLSYQLSDVDTYKNILDISEARAAILTAIKALYGTDVSGIADLDTVIEGVTNLVESSDIILAGADAGTDAALIQNALYIKAIDEIITDIFWENGKIEDTYFAANAVLGANNINAQAAVVSAGYANTYITTASEAMALSFSIEGVKETFVSDNTRPVAKSGLNATISLGETVTLDASGSYDIDGDTLIYFWELYSGEQIEFSNTSSIFQLTPVVADTYVFKLYVSDGIAVSLPDEFRLTVVDSVAPEAVITSHAENELIKTSLVTITGTAYDLAKIAYVQVNGSTASETSANFSTWTVDIELHDAFDQAIIVEVSDISGNRKTTQLIVDVDANGPSAVITAPQTNQVITKSPVYVTGTAADISAITSVKVNGVDATSIEGNYAKWQAYVVPTEGLASVITVETEDELGNKNTSAAEVVVVFDVSGPAITITYPLSGAMLSALTLTVSGTASDVSPIVSFKVNGADVLNGGINYSSWTAAANLTEGTSQKITAIAMDAYGNNTTYEISVTVDKTKPTIAITSPLTGESFYPMVIEVTGSATDNLTGVSSLLVNDTAATNTGTGYSTWSAYISLVKGTTQTITAVAADAAGNTKSTSVQVDVSSIYSGELTLPSGNSLVKMINDPKRPYVYALETANNKLLFINMETISIETELLMGQGPVDMDIDSSGNKLYVACETAKKIYKVDLDLKAVDSQITTAYSPSRVECGALDRLFYFDDTLSGILYVFNLTTLAEIGDTSLLGSYDNFDLEVTADGASLYAAEIGAANPRIINFDVSTDSFVVADQFAANGGTAPGFTSSGLYFDEANGVLYFSTVQIDAGDLSNVKGAMYYDNYREIECFHPSRGMFVGVKASDITFSDSVTFAPVLNKNMQTSDNIVSPGVSAFSPDGNFLLIYDGYYGKLHWFSVNELVSYSQMLALGDVVPDAQPYSYYSFTKFLFDSQRNLLYALDTNKNILAFINPGTLAIEKTIITGSRPADMSINENGDKMYVANYGATSIVEIDLSAQAVAANIVTDYNPYKIACGKTGWAYYVPQIPGATGPWYGRYVNTVTAADVGSFGPASAYSEFIAASTNRNYLFTANGKVIYKYDISSGAPAYMSEGGDAGNDFCSFLNYGSSANAVFFGKMSFDADNLQINLGAFSAVSSGGIVAATTGGNLAFSSSAVFSGTSFQELGSLLLTTSVMTAGSNDSILYLWDDTNKVIITVSLSQY
ncbi:MAG: hypothetical protein HZA48_04425 [Planctomycetes bacterium]|nr:hypothetical protein [Planctomycetota bacterium]